MVVVYVILVAGRKKVPVTDTLAYHLEFTLPSFWRLLSSHTELTSTATDEIQIAIWCTTSVLLTLEFTSQVVCGVRQVIYLATLLLREDPMVSIDISTI